MRRTAKMISQVNSILIGMPNTRAIVIERFI